MTEYEPDDIRPTTEAERSRAMAVNSVDDETRVHAGGDETELVQDAGGELRRADEKDLGEGARTEE